MGPGNLMICQHYTPLPVLLAKSVSSSSCSFMSYLGKRSSKNVRSHSADIIGPLLASTVTYTAKSQSIYGMIKLIAVDHWVLGIRRAQRGATLQAS